MPNGFHGADDEWRRLEASLLTLDETLEAFAKRKGLRLAKNERDWPGRSLTWGRSILRIIQLYLADDGNLTWNLWICASQDRGKERYWRQEFLRRDVQMNELAPAIEELLETAFEKSEAWKSDDLEFATDLRGN